MTKAIGQFIEGFGLAFLAVAIAPIMALSKIMEAFSSFIS